MPSASLCFSVPLFKKQVKRFWPLWTLYFLLYFMLMPIYMLMRAQAGFIPTEPLTAIFQSYLTALSTHGALWIHFGFCILTAMALWSYLYNNRSVSMIHALPLTRGTLFLTNYLTGLLFSIVPSTAVFLLALGVEAFAGALTPRALLLWLLCQILFSLFFFSFATLLAFVTGHILMLPCFYAVFSVLTKGITMLLDGLFSSFVYGYAGASMPALDWFGQWLSPMYALMMEVQPVQPEMAQGILMKLPTEVSGLSVLATYAAAGLVMALLAYLLYRRRSLELSGEVVTVSVLQPIFKYGVAICVGLAFGMIFYQIFRDIFYQGIGSLLFFLLLWSAVGYYAAEMMLQKSFRVFRKGAPGMVALLLILTAAVLAMEYDVTGYEKSVPSAQEIKSVQLLGWEASRYTEPEDIAAVIALHDALVKQKADVEAQNRQYTKSQREGNELYLSTREFLPIEIQYERQDGSLLRRSYALPISQESLDQGDSLASQYQWLINRPQVRLETIFPPSMKEEHLMEVRINVVDYAKQTPGKSRLSGVSFEADPYGKDAVMVLNGEAAKGFYAAMREDIAAGRLGSVVLGSNYNPDYAKRNCVNSIYLTFRQDETAMMENPGRYYDYIQDENGKKVPYLEQRLDLQSTASASMAFLEQCGLVRGVHLLTIEEGQKSGHGPNQGALEKYSASGMGYAPQMLPAQETVPQTAP